MKRKIKLFISTLLLVLQLGTPLLASTTQTGSDRRISVEVTMSEVTEGRYSITAEVRNVNEEYFVNGRLCVLDPNLSTYSQEIATSNYYDISTGIDSATITLEFKPDSSTKYVKVVWYYSDEHYHPESDEYEVYLLMDLPDGTPPTLTVTKSTEAWVKSALLHINTSDNSGVIPTVTCNGITVTLIGSAANVTVSTNGNYTVISQDNSGNKTEQIIIVTNLDYTKPKLQINLSY